MSITEQLQALGMGDLSMELTRERMAFMHQIVVANTLRDELLAALETVRNWAEGTQAMAEGAEDERVWQTVIEAIAKAKKAT